MPRKRKRSKKSPSASQVWSSGRFPAQPFIPNLGPPQPLMSPYMPPLPATMTPFGALLDRVPCPQQRGPPMSNPQPPPPPAPEPRNVKYYDCKVCNIRGMVYSIENMDQHFTSEAHKHMKVFYDNDMWPGRKGTEDRPQIYTFMDTAGSIKCELCRLMQKNGTELLKHQHQPLHLKLLHQFELHTKIPVLFACDVCDVGIRGHDAYLAHNSSTEHLSAVNAKKAPEVERMAPVKELSSTAQQQLMPAPPTLEKPASNNTDKAPSNNYLSLNDKFTTELLTNLVNSLKSLIDATDKSDLLIAAMIKNEQDFSTSDAAATIRQTLLGKIAQECKMRQQTRRAHELSILKMLVDTLQEGKLKSSMGNVVRTTKELFGGATMSDAQGMQAFHSEPMKRRRSRSPSRKSPKMIRRDVARSRSRSPKQDRYSMNYYRSGGGPRAPPPVDSSKQSRVDDKVLPNGKMFRKVQQPVITLKDSPSPPSQSRKIPTLDRKSTKPPGVDKAKVLELLDDSGLSVGKPSFTKSKLSIELRNENTEVIKSTDVSEAKLVTHENNIDQKSEVESKQNDKLQNEAVQAASDTKKDGVDEKPVEIVL